jgi:DNA polymerase-3 subunit gamma/tau
MQILIEAKSRMQRVNYGRALLDLALTRICLLERLDSIATVHQELRSASGTPLPTPRASPPATRTNSPVSTGPTLEPPSKKNGLASHPAGDRASTPAQRETGATQVLAEPVADEVGTPRIELTPESAEAFWSQLLLNTSDTIAAQLKNASQTAISGPNSLEIVFPAGYSFSKTYCERSETLKRIESTASQLAGNPIRIVIRGEQSTAATAKPTPIAPQPALRNRQLEAVRQDPFVQQVLSVFGGSVVEVRQVAGSTDSEV